MVKAILRPIFTLVTCGQSNFILYRTVFTVSCHDFLHSYELNYLPMDQAFTLRIAFQFNFKYKIGLSICSLKPSWGDDAFGSSSTISKVGYKNASFLLDSSQK
jgi:hypothetical protein